MGRTSESPSKPSSQTSASSAVSAEDVAALQQQLADAQAAADAAAADAVAPDVLPISLDEFTNANIDWHALADAAGEDGITLHVAVVKHTFTDSLIPLIPVFEELTGIKVLYDMLPPTANCASRQTRFGLPIWPTTSPMPSVRN